MDVDESFSRVQKDRAEYTQHLEQDHAMGRTEAWLWVTGVVSAHSEECTLGARKRKLLYRQTAPPGVEESEGGAA